MAFGIFIFSETAPSSAATAASSQPVQNAQSSLAAGVAGPLDDWEGMDVVAELTGNTGGTLNVFLQTSPDAGAHWYDVISWPQVPAGSTVRYFQTPLSLATNTTTAPQVGKDLSPSLAPGTVVNGAWCDRVRLVMVSGSGTSAGGSVVVKLCGQFPDANNK